jgi:putative radical SAM enzyme (TIGR03279 family)
VVRIAEIEAGSIADELHLEIGTRIIRINGEPVRDGIDLTFLLAEPDVEMEMVTPAGERVIYEVDREPGERLGIVPAPDTVRECANKCVFCFIDGKPQGVRTSLWLRDDDFRLSFTYGNYVTLTNLGSRGLQRLVDQRLSPLYVSVHATEPEVRARLLVNERAGLVMDQLRFLTGAGLEVHTQVVLCPGWNDGEHLDHTIDDLWSLGPGILSLSVVPVGLTRYNLDRPVRLMTPAEAERALPQVDAARERALKERRQGWCYAADEMFLLAGHPIPEAAYYDDWPLTENGVGSLRRAMDDFDEGISRVPRLSRRRIILVTGRSMGPFFEERAARLRKATGAEVEVVAVTNRFYGETVTTAGLLAGRDMLDAARERWRELECAGGSGATRAAGEADLVLLPAEALNADGLFIDSFSLDDFKAAVSPAKVVTRYEITEVLRAL